MKLVSRIIISSLLASLPIWAIAQDSEDDLQIIEMEIEHGSVNKKSAPKSEAKESTSGQTEEKHIDFSGLGNLAEFSDVSVIQKRFLPKSGRVQAFAGLSYITNDPFFNIMGLSLKGNYHLSEKWGIELGYSSFQSSQAKATDELRKLSGVKTDNLVELKDTFGVDIVWTPIYGKLAFREGVIVPFDMYFAGGMGSTGVSTGRVPSYHVGAGQIFAVSKGFAYRWDFSLTNYTAKAADGTGSGFNNLFVSIGASWFWPEARYR